MSKNDQEGHLRVFISYSHDSREHAKRVLDLADRLVEDGVDCILDQYAESPPEGWPRWMDTHIRDADFVLMVCTEIYFKRVMGKEKAGTGRGVKWEGNLIYQHLYDADAINRRFIPVLFNAADERFIPTPMRSVTYYCLDSEAGYEDLYRRLTNQPRAKKPKLGKLKKLPPRERKTDFFSENTDIYCSERFSKTRRFKKIAGILSNRDQPFDLCSKKKKVQKCQLHKDTIGMGLDVRQYDSRTGKVLLVVDLLEEIKPYIKDVLKGSDWKGTMGNLNQNIRRFFDDIKEFVLEKNNSEAVDITSETKAALKEVVEDPSVKRSVDEFVDSLIYFWENYTSTSMFLKNNTSRQKKDRKLLSSLAMMPSHIERLRREMLKNTRSDCEISAGCIDLTIRKDPKIRKHDTGTFKIVATSDKSRTVLKNIGAL